MRVSNLKKKIYKKILLHASELLIRISELLLFGTMMVGQAFAFAPNANKGAVSAARIFHILERKPEIDSSLDSGIALVSDFSVKWLGTKVF